MGGLGDFYRAVRQLHPDEEEARVIARMLGLELREIGGVAEKKPEPVAPAPAPVAPLPAAAPAAKEPFVEMSARPMYAEGEETPAWLANVTPLPAERAGYRQPVLPFDPLIPQNKVRAMLSTLLATQVEEGPIDIGRLISLIARNEPMKRLYRQRSLTARRGVQVLIDRSESMMLFSRDARSLVKDLQNVIGIPRVELLLFADCPSRGAGAPADEEWREYRAPATGTPVLLLTDFGIGAAPIARATSAEWERFFTVTRAAACPVVALVPYASDRWPGAIASYVACVVWDGASTIQMARRAASAARRRKAS